jgi:hypothetical protein
MIAFVKEEEGTCAGRCCFVERLRSNGMEGGDSGEMERYWLGRRLLLTMLLLLNWCVLWVGGDVGDGVGSKEVRAFNCCCSRRSCWVVEILVGSICCDE